ncbi:MAG TPA: TonB-dependent receptor [bacterium]|nr:TonB-dependent receptor [bacterium]
MLWETPVANVAAGGRFDSNNRFGNTLVPRLALTKVFDPFHVKLLFCKGFRPPGLGNLDYNPDVKPESTTALEAELGYKISDAAIVTANIFDITIDKPLLYTSAVNGTASYFNFARTGTTGAEVTLQGTLLGANVAASYSFYTAAGKNRVTDYEIPGHSDVLNGFPHHKVTLSAEAPLWKQLRLGTTDTWLGERWSYTGQDSSGNLIGGRLPPILLASAFLDWRAVVRDVDLRVGIYNALNSRYLLPEPYDGYHPPLPAEPREVAVHASFRF